MGTGEELPYSLGCQRLPSFFFLLFFFLWNRRHAWQLCRSLSHGHRRRLGKSPARSGGAASIGQSHPKRPVPRASLSAAGSLHRLLSGALPEPKITQSRPGAPLWLPSTFTPACGKDLSQPELGEAGAPVSAHWKAKGLTHGLVPAVAAVCCAPTVCRAQG